jgi:hypothetical protein
MFFEGLKGLASSDSRAAVGEREEKKVGRRWTRA